MTENVRKVFNMLGVEPNERFKIKGSRTFKYEFYFDEKLCSYIVNGKKVDILSQILNGTYKIIKLTNKKHVGDLICKDLECRNCPLYSINCDIGDSYSNLYKILEFHYKQFKDKEIYDLFKKCLDKEVEE